jgi:phosphoadenosine phosphosulfate reductase
MNIAISSRTWQMPEPSKSPLAVEAQMALLKERIRRITARHKDVRFATSLGAEDVIVTHAIAEARLPVRIFTLDTGRLPRETVDMISVVADFYRLGIERIHPLPGNVTDFVTHYGLNGFFESEEAKVACCNLRKVEPLDCALQGADAWLTGLRRSQSLTRQEVTLEQFDQERGLVKYNPLLDWDDDDVWSAVQLLDMPIHPLHRRGYPSIGCEPCTRAIREGEDLRAGRWWWLESTHKECGLHLKANKP